LNVDGLGRDAERAGANAQDFASLQMNENPNIIMAGLLEGKKVMEKFKGKYRISSTRLSEWDYGSNAAYFVTICTANRTHDFGEINGDAMELAPLGQAALDCWNHIPVHFPFVILDGFVVMPNHVHGILIINKCDDKGTQDIEKQNIGTQNIETQNIASLRGNRFGPQSQNLGAIIRGYKIGVTKFAHENKISFKWQPRYYEHIIRDVLEYERIYNYLQENPQKWAKDRFYEPGVSFPNGKFAPQ
jgi:REP element-mobilizing transposase RayT